MALPYTPKNWQLSSYTNNTWTDLVSEAGIVQTLSISNPTGTPIDVEIRREDASSGLAVILPATTIDTNQSYVLEKVINVTGTQAIQIKCDLAGIEFDANGVV